MQMEMQGGHMYTVVINNLSVLKSYFTDVSRSESQRFQ